jgi:hypothetical protein
VILGVIATFAVFLCLRDLVTLRNPRAWGYIKGIGHLFYSRSVLRVANKLLSYERTGIMIELSNEQIDNVSGGKCKLADGQAGHALGDKHEGESAGARLWRAISEAFFGGSHCG